MSLASEIALLLEVQEMDQEIRTLQAQLARYPEVWEEVKEGLRRKTAKVEEIENAEERRKQERVKIEQELRLNGDKLKQYQSQQMLVKSSRELTALNAQIESIRKNIARLEERGLALLDEDASHVERLDAARAELAKTKEYARTERDRIRNQVAEKKTRLDKVRADRDRQIKKIPPALLDNYEHTRNRWAENPIVSARTGSCTGCHFALLPNRLVELHRAETIVHCDNCGRILSHDESFHPEQEEASV